MNYIAIFSSNCRLHSTSVVQLCSCVQFFAIPWTVAHQSLLSMGFSRQGYWSGLPFPPPEDLPDPGTEPASPALAAEFFTTEPPGKPQQYRQHPINTLLKKANLSGHLINEVPDVPWVWGCRSNWVLGLRMDGPLIQPSDSNWLDGIWLYRIRLLELAQIVVLQKTRPKPHGRWA